MIIRIAEEFTTTPGGRYYTDGPFSGERFRDEVLKPRFLAAAECGESLIVDLDGGYGYGTSFLDEAFGGLARELRDPRIAEIEIISNEEPILIKRIQGYIANGLRGK